MLRKATKRLIRSLFLTIAVIVAAVIFGGPPLIERVVGVDTLAAWISGELSRHLNRQLLIGDISFSFFGGMDLRDVQISEPPTFREGTFIKANRFILRPSLGDLLIGNVNVTEIRLEGADIQLVRNSSGVWNLSDIFAKPADIPESMVLRGPEDEAALPAAFSLDVENLRISDSRFRLIDALGKIPEFSAKDIEVQLSDFSLQAPFKTSVEFVLEPATSVPAFMLDWLPPPLHVSLKGKSHLTEGNWKQMNFSLQRFNVKSRFWTMESTATVRSLSPLTGRINAHLDFNNFKVDAGTRTLDFSGPADLNIRLRLANGNAAPQTNTPLSISQGMIHSSSTYELKLSADDLQVSLGNIVEKPAGLGFKLESMGSFGMPPAQRAGLEGMKEVHGNLLLHLSSAPPAKMDFWRLRWPSKTASASLPRLEVQASTASFSTGPLYSLFPVLKGWQTRDGTLHWRDAGFRRWRDRWILAAKGLHLKQTGISKRSQKIGMMEAAVETAEMRGKGREFETDFKSFIELKDADTRFLSARELVVVADMKGVGNSPKPVINGEIHAHLDSGALKEVSTLVEYADFLQFLIKPLRIIEDLDYWGILRLDDVDFNSVEMSAMRADYLFYESKMSLEKISMKGPVGTVEVRGSINFPGNDINLVSTVNVPKGKTPFAMASSFTDAAGNPLFSIKIKGPLNKPEVYTIPANKKDMLASDFDSQFKAFRKKVRDVWGKIFR